MQSVQFLYPELILTTCALVALMGGAFTKNKNLLGAFAILGILGALALLPLSFKAQMLFPFGMLVNDSISIIFRTIIVVIAAFITLLSLEYKELDSDNTGEYYFFLLTVSVAMMIAVSSNNLLMIYIALEGVSIMSYIMAGFLKRDIFCSEAGVKYFLFGVLATGVTLYGVSLVYGLFGTLHLDVLCHGISSGFNHHEPLLFALALILAGFCFKCSLVPFHMWTPDVYQGAPTPVAALLSVGPKAMGFAFLLRVFVVHFQPAIVSWTFFAGVIAMVTMTVGNICAIGQNNIKRLLAYSTIAQAGYIFAGLAIATLIGIQATLFYICVYILMNVGAFAAVIMVSNSLSSESIEDYAGLYKKDPFVAIALAVSLLSLAGIPPLAGFLAKFFVLVAAVEAKLTLLAIVIVLNSVIALYYYIRIVKFMFLDEPKDTRPILKSPALQLALVMTVIGNIVFGLWPHGIMNWLTALLHLI